MLPTQTDSIRLGDFNSQTVKGITMNITTPIVHMNGTSRDALVEMRCEVYHKLNDAYDALKQMAPHGRDYYIKENGNTALVCAQRLHMKRLKVIHDLQEEISAEAIEIQAQGK
jgi:hypothetical protein